MNFVTFIFLASGVLWLLKGKPNGAWYWLSRNQLLFTFCGICITSNSTKRSTTRTNLSPLTFFLWNQWVPSDSLQNTQAYTCLFLVHKSSMWSEKAEGFGFNCFDFIFIIYILWDVKVLNNIHIKMGNIMAHKRWATFTLLFLLAFVMVTSHQFEGKYWSITQPSLCLMDKKQFTLVSYFNHQPLATPCYRVTLLHSSSERGCLSSILRRSEGHDEANLDNTHLR